MNLQVEQARQMSLEIRKCLDIAVPPMVGYELSLFSKIVGPYVSSLEEQRVLLVKKHGEDVDGKTQVPEARQADFYAEYRPLAEKQIEVAATPIPIESLKDCRLPVSFFIVCEPLLSK